MIMKLQIIKEAQKKINDDKLIKIKNIFTWLKNKIKWKRNNTKFIVLFYISFVLLHNHPCETTEYI